MMMIMMKLMVILPLMLASGRCRRYVIIIILASHKAKRLTNMVQSEHSGYWPVAIPAHSLAVFRQVVNIAHREMLLLLLLL